MAAPSALVSEGDVCPVAYRPRNPRTSSLYQLVDHHYETVKGAWEERFERRYGFWNGFYEHVVHGYLDCGLFESGLRSSSFGQARRSLAEASGFARVRCTQCPNEFLVAFSCKGYPSDTEGLHLGRRSLGEGGKLACYLMRAPVDQTISP